MAMAVQRTYKDARVTVGPWTERGFFYDFDIKEPLTGRSNDVLALQRSIHKCNTSCVISDKDLKKIRKEMQKIVRANLPFVREEV